MTTFPRFGKDVNNVYNKYFILLIHALNKIQHNCYKPFILLILLSGLSIRTARIDVKF